MNKIKGLLKSVILSGIPLLAAVLFSVTGCVKTVAVTGVSLDKKTLTLTVGESANLVATVAPEGATDGSVTWSSSNTAVATVNGGLVKAVSAGTANITVTTADGGKTDVCRVTVAEKVINVTGVTLDKTSLTLYEGTKDTLYATVTPPDATDLTVAWKSSDEAVATVDGLGAVTAVKAGSATINVRTTDGGKSAECVVTVVADAVTDSKFKDLVLGEFDKDGDGFLSDVETEAVKEIDCEGKGIKSLEGIELFPKLEIVKCSGNEIDTIDVTKNTNLVSIDCSKNKLRRLKVNGLPKLEMIDCSHNLLDTIDISENESLEDLDCSDNKIVEIRVDAPVSAPSFASDVRPFATKVFRLTNLDASNNKITNIGRVGLKYPGISKMNVSLNPIDRFVLNDMSEFTGVILDDCPKLTYVECKNNPKMYNLSLKNCPVLDTVIVVSTILDNLSLTSSNALVYFDCADSKLTSLDLSGRKNLQRLYCYENEIETIDVRGDEALQVMNVYDNKLSSIDVSENTGLESLIIFNNKISSIDLSKNVLLQDLSCRNNQLTSLDISANKQLMQVECQSNQLSSLDATSMAFTNGGSSFDLYCGNQTDASGNARVLTLKLRKDQKGYWESDLSSNKKNLNVKLAGIPVDIPDPVFKAYLIKQYDKDGDKEITEVEAAEITLIRVEGLGVKDLTGIKYFNNLNRLYCSDNKLNSLDINDNIKLEILYCDSTGLQTLDVGSLAVLSELECDGNALQSLDLSGNPELMSLKCGDNALKTLNIKENSKLRYLFSGNNALTSLDVTGNPNLELIECSNNGLEELDLSASGSLSALLCSENGLKSLEIGNNDKLTVLHCSHNKISSLDLSKAKELYSLHCDGNCLKTLDATKMKVKEVGGAKLFNLYCGNQIDDDKAPVTLELTITKGQNEIWKEKLAADERNTNVNVNVFKIPITGVSLDYADEVMASGNTLELHAIWMPAEATATDLVWTSSDDKIAEVVSQGSYATVTAKAEGYAVITVKAESGVSATCRIKVETAIDIPDPYFKKYLLNMCDYNKDSQITYSEAMAVKIIDAHDQYIEDLAGVEHFKNLYSLICSNNQIRSLDVTNFADLVELDCSNNHLESLDVSKNTSLTDLTCFHNIITTLDISNNPNLTKLLCYENKLSTLDITKMRDAYQVVCGSQYNSDPLVLTLREDMLESWNAAQSSSGYNNNVVVHIPVSSITMVEGHITLKVGEIGQIHATILPLIATNYNVTWTSDRPAIAVVEDGDVQQGGTVYAAVTAVSVGETKITVTTEDGGKTAECLVTVLPADIPVKGLTLGNRDLQLEVGDKADLTATVDPVDATNDSVYWAVVDTNVIKVAPKPGSYLKAEVTAVGEGSSTVMAWTADGDFKASCVVKVSPKTIFVTGVTLDHTTLNMLVEEDAELRATVLPDNAKNKNVSWMSSNPQVVTVAKVDGETDLAQLTAVAAGKATITVTTEDGTYTASCAVTVENATVGVTEVRLDKDTLITTAGGKLRTLHATISPDNATNKEMSWTSSNPTVATVTPLATAVGLAQVTPLKQGYTTITVTTKDGAKVANCYVTVNAGTVSVTSVGLDAEKLAMIVGEEANLNATINPSDATNKNLVWNSSDGRVVGVQALENDNTKAHLQAYAEGTSTVSVTTEDGNFSASCVVSVAAGTVRVTGIVLSETKLAMTVGDYKRVTATVSPLDATNDKVIWSSNNENVVTVDAANSYTTVIFNAVGTGDAIVTATTEDGGFSALCHISVTAGTVSVTGIKMGRTRVTKYVGDTVNLTAKVIPENATNQNIIWSSGSETTTVDEYGCVRLGSEPGEVVITATTVEGGFKGETLITINNRLSEISLGNWTSATLAPAETLQLEAYFYPAEGVDKTVTWSSSNTAVATVSETGLVTAVADGTADITVTGIDGIHSATCHVTVATQMNMNMSLYGAIAAETADVDHYMTQTESGSWTFEGTFANGDSFYFRIMNEAGGYTTYGAQVGSSNSLTANGPVTISSGSTTEIVVGEADGTYLITVDPYAQTTSPYVSITPIAYN